MKTDAGSTPAPGTSTCEVSLTTPTEMTSTTTVYANTTLPKSGSATCAHSPPTVLCTMFLLLGSKTLSGTEP